MRFVVLLLFTLYSICGASQMRFTHIKVEDGLSQSSVNSVIKDKNGYYFKMRMIDFYDGSGNKGTITLEYQRI